MSILGHVTGQTTATVLHLPFTNGSTANNTDGAVTVTKVSTLGEVDYAEGPIDDALQFGTVGISASARVRLDCTGAPLAIAGDQTIDLWCLPQDTSTTQTLLAWRKTGGSELDRMVITLAATTITATVYNAAGTSWSVSNAVPLPWTNASMTKPRWMHIRLAIDVGAFLYLFVDGVLVGKATTTIVALDTGNVGPLQIGGEASATATSQFIGRIADVMLRSELDIDPKTCAPNLGPKRITRRHLTVQNIDLPEHAEADSWTSSGGGYWIADTALDLGSLIVDREDIVSIAATTSAGVRTVFTELGNATDALAGTNNWAWVHSTRRIYVSENPASYSSFAITVRLRLGNERLRIGDRWAIPALANIDAPGRRLAYFDEPWQSGDGGRIVIAKHSEIPSDIGNEEATDIAWPFAAMKTYTISDGMPWSEAIVDAGGFVHAPPADAPDSWTAETYHEAAKVHLLPLADRIADTATYPYMLEKDRGHVWPAVAGKGHLRVKAVCIDRRRTSLYGQSLAQYKVIATPATGLKGLTFLHVGVGPSLLTTARVYDIDLDTGQFYGPLEWALNEMDVWADVAGWGTPSDPTSTPGTAVMSWGTPADCSTGGAAIGQELLKMAGFSSFGSTWTGTFGRALGEWRIAEGLPDANTLGAMLTRFSDDMLARPYFVPSTGYWECEDVVKADASQWTIRDEDVIEIEWRADRSLLAQRANVTAYDYSRAQSGEVRKGAPTTLSLNAKIRSGVREIWQPDRFVGHSTVGAADLWLAAIRPHLENVTHFCRVVVGSSYRSIEQFDVVTMSVDSLPSGAGARFRVLAVKPSANGTVALELFPEANWPSTGASLPGTRSGASPIYVSQLIPGDGGSLYHGGPGYSIGVTGTWTTVHIGIFDYIAGRNYATDITDRFAVRARRIGGATDADLTFRVTADATRSTKTSIAATAGHGTTVGFAGVNFTRPTARKFLRFEYLLAVGTSGRLHSMGWQAEEGTTNAPSTTMLPTTLWEQCYWPGAVCAPTSTLQLVPNFRGGILSTDFLRPGSILNWVIYADGSAATNFRCFIFATRTYGWASETAPGPLNPVRIARVTDFGAHWNGPISADGFREAQGLEYTAEQMYNFRLYYMLDGGVGRVYAVGLYLHQAGQ